MVEENESFNQTGSADTNDSFVETETSNQESNGSFIENDSTDTTLENEGAKENREALKRVRDSLAKDRHQEIGTEERKVYDPNSSVSGILKFRNGTTNARKYLESKAGIRKISGKLRREVRGVKPKEIETYMKLLQMRNQLKRQNRIKLKSNEVIELEKDIATGRPTGEKPRRFFKSLKEAGLIKNPKDIKRLIRPMKARGITNALTGRKTFIDLEKERAAGEQSLRGNGRIAGRTDSRPTRHL